jgi:hypothetical protein
MSHLVSWIGDGRHGNLRSIPGRDTDFSVFIALRLAVGSGELLPNGYRGFSPCRRVKLTTQGQVWLDLYLMTDA